ncbi:hypothetical protein FXO37_12947 [Capsicum annuum]|nr:hypothetical protein FXO37_12947 [Capsicum annuum]
MGFDFRVEYKAGRINTAADALSRREEVGDMLFVISQPEVLIFEEVRAKVKQSPILHELRAKIEQGEMNSNWVFRDGFLFFKDRVHLSPNSPLVNFVLSGIHDSTHKGVQKTMLRIRKDFYWPAMKTTIKDLLLPVQFASVIRLDRDALFTSTIWKELFRLYGAKLNFSSAYHPQSDGQTEVVNRTIEMYLRRLHFTHPPFQFVYGREPPRLQSYMASSSRVDVVDRALIDRDVALQDFRAKLQQAQHKMKTVYDKGHRDVEFSPGSYV